MHAHCGGTVGSSHPSSPFPGFLLFLEPFCIFKYRPFSEQCFCGRKKPGLLDRGQALSSRPKEISYMATKEIRHLGREYLPPRELIPVERLGFPQQITFLKEDNSTRGPLQSIPTYQEA